METKTINQWMAHFGYRWVEGQEQLLKGELSYNDAADTIGQLLRQGAVTKRG